MAGNFVSRICSIVVPRHCGCVFKDMKNVPKLNSLVRGLLVTSVNLIKHLIRALIIDSDEPNRRKNQPKSKPKVKERALIVDDSVDSLELSDEAIDEDEDDDNDVELDSHMDDFENVSKWPLEDKEKLFHLVSKVFYIHFPLYAVHKNSFHQPRLDDLTPKEAALLSSYCDLNDPEVPILLLRNLCFYCEQDIIDLFVALFTKATPLNLPLTLSHAMIVVIHHLKYGLNVNSMLAKLVSLRTCVISYLCKVSIHFLV